MSFLDEALTDLGDSPWARVIARAAPREATAARAAMPAASPKSAAPIPEAVDPKPLTAPPTPEAVDPKPPTAPPTPEAVDPIPPAVLPTAEAVDPIPPITVPDPKPAIQEPQALPPKPTPRRFAGVPHGSPLAKIERGMHHGEVRRILGDPDARRNRLTAKAWIPFYDPPGARLIDWIYYGVGRVVFSLHTGSLELFDVIHDPSEPK
jgi:hypothetical protein